MAKVAGVETETHPEPLAAAIVELARTLGANQSQLAETLSMLQQNQRPREINFGDADYQAKLRAERVEFPRPVFQGGREADPSGQSAETLAQIAALKPGKYLGGFVTIEPTANDGINFLYKNSTPDQRMTQMGKFSSFADLVAKCHQELA